jgi:hypothetical protein
MSSVFDHPPVHVTSSDVLWIRFRIATLLAAAQAMAETERWELSESVVGDARWLFEITRKASQGVLHRGDVTPGWPLLMTRRAETVDASGYAQAAMAYRDIALTLKRYE